MSKKILYFINAVQIPKKTLMLLICLTIVSVSTVLTIPILIGRAIDLLILSTIDFTTLKYSLLIIALLILLFFFVSYAITWKINKLAYNVSGNFQKQLYKKIYRLSLLDIDKSKHGEIASRLTSDIDLVITGVISSITSLSSGIITIIFTIIIMLFLDIVVGLVVIILTPLSLLVASLIVARTHKYFQEQVELRANITAFVNERIENQEMIMQYNYGEKNIEDFDEINNKLHKNGIKFQFYGALVNPTTRFINSLLYASVCLVGSFAVLQGRFEVGVLVSFLAYASQYTKPFNELATVFSEVQISMIAMKRIEEFLEYDEVTINSKNQLSKNIEGQIDIEDISFEYTNGMPVINNLSIKIPSKKTTAIVGHTGSGKTTILQLLLGFYTCTTGNIYIDGKDVSKLSASDLHRCYAMVLQEPWIFDGTIRENIIYAKPNASHQEMLEITKSTYVDEFVSHLDKGYDTLITSDRSILSKGQKQLISIARMMLANPQVILLDEATSAIDSATELKIQNAIETMMSGKTTIIVAHRLSTIKNADNIVVMEGGTVVESGSHDRLMKQDGYYKELYDIQFR